MLNISMNQGEIWVKRKCTRSVRSTRSLLIHNHMCVYIQYKQLISCLIEIAGYVLQAFPYIDGMKNV